MNYIVFMSALDTSGLGALIMRPDHTIAKINDAGAKLIGWEDTILDKPIELVAPILLEDHTTDGEIHYGSTNFNHYITPVEVPPVTGLQPGHKLFAFRDATMDVRAYLLQNVLDKIDDSATIWDNSGRMLMLNNAAAKLESHLIEDVIGKKGDELYQTQNDSILVIPEVIRSKTPILNLRQDFTTHSGKELQIVSDNYPLSKDGEMLGAVSIMHDNTQMEAFHTRIIELQRALEGQKKAPSSRKKKSALTAKYTFNDIIYKGTAMRDVVKKCMRIAASDASVLIYGETGTGKELFAQSIHNGSRRKDGPFLAINCAAIPDTLLESMLFGTEKGAYTGSVKREGLFEQADGGTLLLDEINSMDILLQSKLLRVLQEGNLRRVGGSELIDVDVRVISNINIPPLEAIKKEKLREDLYYRLGVININIPPLRNRKEDIPILVKNFMMKYNKKLGRSVTELSNSVREIFDAYDWPGNVRELNHAVEYAMHIIPDDESVIRPEYLPDHIQNKIHGIDSQGAAADSSGDNETMEQVMEEAGRRFLLRRLSEHEGNITHTAQALGITRQNLQHRLKKMHISVDRAGNITINN